MILQYRDIVSIELLLTHWSSIEDLEKEVLPNITNNYLRNRDWVCKCVILAPKNDDVNRIQPKISDVVTEKYRSIDTVIEYDQLSSRIFQFNRVPGIPPNKLILKIGSQILLLRNSKHDKVIQRNNGK